MKEIIDKISSYNLFNNLFPGVLFVICSSKITTFNLVIESDILGFFVYYFVGMVINRIGSLIVEEALKKTKFIKFKPYAEFISASQKDAKIEILSETNNTYRTIIATMVSLIIIKVYNMLALYFRFDNEVNYFVAISIIIAIFIPAYKKQVSYISKRIEKANESIT